MGVAAPTMRRCTPPFRATPITGPTPNSHSRRICSYSFTLALQSNSPSVPHITEKQSRVRTAQGWANLNRHTGPNQNARISETHDATQVCETTYRGLSDFKEMLSYMCTHGAARPAYDPDHPATGASIRATFMKRLFVGMSRLRVLLCLAIRKGSSTQALESSLVEAMGWRVVQIASSVD